MKRFDKPADPQETFALLLSAAKNDNSLKKSLLFILSQPDFHRKSALNSLLSTMRLSNAPADLVSAMEVLLDDSAAKKAEAFLRGNFSQS